jgi:pimeloyl-ACP methyl ester carboxylesterase
MQVRHVHTGIARRVFSAIGPLALPVRLAHDVIARGAYMAAGEVGRVVVRGGAGTLALAASAAPGSALGSGSLEDSVGGRTVVGVLNGAVGDALARRGNRLALPMTLRARGRDVEPSYDGLRRAYPAPTPRLIVFAHGLGQTEDAWSLRNAPYGVRLSAELGYTPLYVRYNSGRHISENGRELARLLEQVVSAWPTEVSEIALVGHSIGGLVARSACHYGAGRSWTRLVRQVISLGTPHLGARYERLTAAAGAMLARVPETRPVARALEARSAGIKDLRHGSLVDEDWTGSAPSEIPFLPSASYYFVSADGLAPVGRASAWAHPGGGQPMRFPVHHYREIRGVGHFDLLNHPAVYETIRGWLTGRPALPGPSAGG